MRIDAYLVSKGKFDSRTKAKEAIERGEVLVNGKDVKPSCDVSDKDEITFNKNAGAFVSNGAFKLLRAFEVFGFSVTDKTVLDIGASTGGFTQVLLLNGAKKVYALDVGEGLLHGSLANDPRVVKVENTNARYISKDTFGEKLDAVVSDVSFISLSYILPVIAGLLVDNSDCVLLIKPQFECGREALSKNGIVTSPKKRAQACNNIISLANSVGLGAVGLAVAPIKDGKNREYLVHFVKSVPVKVSEDTVAAVCSE